MSDKVAHNMKSLDKESATISQRRSRSVFLPVLLIGGGILLLLSNMGMISGLGWSAVFSLWPLFLIFIGLDVIGRQASPPTGTLLSGVIALAAVALFGYVLFSGNPLFGLGVGQGANELRLETFELPVEGVETAEITIDLGNSSAEINALPDNNNLIAGSIYTAGDLVFDTEVEDGRAEVTVGDENTAWLLNPALWFQDQAEQTWQFSLNERLPTDLRIDVGNGSGTAELDQLTLTSLTVDGGNGSFRATLPPGSYEAVVDGGNGSMDLTLPGSGEQSMRIDSGNGSIDLFLPANVEARVEFDEGNGSVNVDVRFSLVSGDEEEGVYETAGYADTTDRVTMDLETGNGSVSISQH